MRFTAGAMLWGAIQPEKRMGEARRRQSEAHPAMSSKRADSSRPLPRPLVIPAVMTLRPTVMTLRTLADVRALLRHLPPEHRERPTWRHVRAGRSACTAHAAEAHR